jgi:hypothetical protein
VAEQPAAAYDINNTKDAQNITLCEKKPFKALRCLSRLFSAVPTDPAIRRNSCGEGIPIAERRAMQAWYPQVHDPDYATVVM